MQEKCKVADGRDMRSPIWWFGGKGQMTSKLVKLIPEHQTYVEPFGGGASLLFAKYPSPVEVYNDIGEGAALEKQARTEVVWLSPNAVIQDKLSLL